MNPFTNLTAFFLRLSNGLVEQTSLHLKSKMSDQELIEKLAYDVHFNRPSNDMGISTYVMAAKREIESRFIANPEDHPLLAPYMQAIAAIDPFLQYDPFTVAKHLFELTRPVYEDAFRKPPQRQPIVQ